MELKTDELTEGELVIEQYLIDEGIKYEAQKEIKGLREDRYRTYRIADFYLPKFDIYIEFLGKWNGGESFRQDYKEKMKIYNSNNLACVYIWPDNLGFLKQALNYRIERELRMRNKKRHLAKFKWYQVDTDTNKYIVIFLLISTFLFFWLTRDNHTDWMVRVRLVVIILLLFYAFLLFVGISLSVLYYLVLRFVTNDKLESWLRRIL